MENKYLTAQRTSNVSQAPSMPVAQQIMMKQQTLVFGIGTKSKQGWFGAPKKRGFPNFNNRKFNHYNDDRWTKGELIAAGTFLTGFALTCKGN